MKEKKKEKKVLILNDLLKRAEQSAGDKVRIAEYDSEELGGVIKFESMPTSEYIALSDRYSDASESLEKSMDFNEALVYNHCSFFRDKSLQEAYHCAEPYNVVRKVFNGNLGEIIECTKVISSLYGLDKVIDDVKNS